jgi:hypothetical protein
MIHTLNDGTTIETTVSDGYSGPDGKPGCQRTSKNEEWLKINGGKWEMSPFRSMHRTRLMIQESNTLAEFMQKMEEYNK